MSIRVLIYEDNKDLRESLSQLISNTNGFEFAAAFSNCKDVEEQLKKYKPNLILMDIDMPYVNGLEGLKRIRLVDDVVNVVMLTVFEDNDNIFEAIRGGANGYLLKKSSPAKLIEALQEVMNGGAPMTPEISKRVLQFIAKPTSTSEIFNLSERENRVLQLLVEGYSYKMIAAELFISLDTVRTHIKNIYDKLHVHSRGEAVAKAMKNKPI